MKKLTLLYFYLACLCLHAHASVEFNQPDTVHVTALLKTASSYATVNKDSAYYYIEKALQYAEKINDQASLMKSNRAMANWLIQQLQRTEAIGYLQEALTLAKALHRQAAEYELLDELGNQSFRIGNFIDAETYYQQALEISRVTHNRRSMITLYTNLGMTYTKLTEYSKAFDALTLSNQLADSLHLNANIAGNYIDIAALLGLQKRFKESLQYYQKAAEGFTLEKDTTMVGYAQLGIGETYMQMGNFHQAIDFFLSIEKSMIETHSQFTFYQNLAISFRSVNQPGKAEIYLGKAQQVNDRLIKNSFYTLKNNIERARLALQQGQFARGITFARKAEDLARKERLLFNYKECLEVLASLYAASGDVIAAQQYQKQFGIIQDSIEHINQSQRLAEAETRFRLGEKNREVELLAKENELQKARKRFDQSVMIALGGLLIILLLAAGYTTMAYRRTQMKNALLAAQKEEIEKANQLITEQSLQLKTVDELKSRFFANISHELRTPVTLLTGMLEFMNEGITTQKEKERVTIALGNSRKLNTLVEEMLDLTRLESGKIILQKKTVPIQPLLNRITGAFGSLLEKKKLRMVTDHLTTQPVCVDVDVDKFEKIINNLIYNAIKFTAAEGWIRLQTKLTDDKNYIEIRVSDSGTGIAKEDLPHIFDRFYQSESSTQKSDVQGTGIGLSLVKEFTVLHGGEVSVSSRPGEGAVFTLQFPVVEAAHTELAEEPREEPFAWKKFDQSPSVLLVEDHEEMRAYVHELLGDGFKVYEAGNGAEGLQWLATNAADLIISDVMMPQMDGYTFLSNLKADKQLQHIPVIMLTARATEEDKLHGLSLGVDDYLTKPFNATELRIRVQNVLLNQIKRKEWLLKPAQPEEATDTTTSSKVFMDTVVAYVEARIEDPLIAVGDLASHLALSDRQLYRKAGELTGLSPAQLIKEIRLMKAYQLLMEKKVNKVAELASRVGYESAAYFSKQFMERFGKRPVEYL